MHRFVIFDGHAIIHRAYHALPPMTTKDGTVVHAVYGFTSMMLRVMSELKPDALAVSFDMAGGTFRDALYEPYKGTREKIDDDLVSQFPLVTRMVEAFGIPVYEKKGYEADDVIGTIVKDKALQKKVDEIIIVTGDRDLLQLADEKVKVYLLRKGLSEMALLGPKEVEELYGFPPVRVPDFKGLRGDTSDNIPGIKGIGEKGATELIQKMGSLEEIYKKVGTLADNGFKKGLIEKIESGKEMAFLSKRLATIETQVPDLHFSFDKATVANFSFDKAKELLKKFEFFSLIKRIPGEEGAESEGSPAKTKKKEKAVEAILLRNEKETFAFIALCKKTGRVVVREKLSSTDPFAAKLAECVCAVAGKAYRLSHEPLETVAALFQDPALHIVGHDIKELIKFLRIQKKETKARLFDVMIASYIVNSSTRAHDLPGIAMRELGLSSDLFAPQQSLLDDAKERGVEEAMFIEQLFPYFEKKLEEMNDKGLFEQVEMALLPVLGGMEVCGVAVDTERLGALSKKTAKSIEKISKEIWKDAGEEFNISSSTQLRDILFTKLELPVQGIKKGKTGYSTSASELEKLRGMHPLVEKIEEYRELEKLRNTYIDVLPTLVNPKTGRIHTHFNQAVAATGRLSSTDPNLQNIPIRTELGREIRNAFVAEKGNILISADYSQIELRIAASLAKDKTMIEIFEKGEDIHTATAAAIHGIPIEQVTKEIRRTAKEVNFGVLYGMGAFGLSARTGLPQWQAKEFIEKYFERFAGVKKYIDETLKEARKTGYVETLFGRRRYIPELASSNFQLRSMGERMAVNMPIQGTAADLMKMAMIDVWKALEGQDDARLTLQVHDELVLEVTKGKEEEIGALVKERMEHIVTLLVPVVVDVHVGDRWGDLK